MDIFDSEDIKKTDTWELFEKGRNYIRQMNVYSDTERKQRHWVKEIKNKALERKERDGLKRNKKEEGNTLNHFLIVPPLALILGLTSFPLSTVLK